VSSLPWRPPPPEIETEGWPWWKPVRKSDIALTAAGAVTASKQVMPSGRCKQICGWAFAETTGAATASFRLRDGTTANDFVLAKINLNASESTRDRWAPPGIDCVSGAVFLEVLSGSIEGVIYWI
jgi:hypothetical protein